MHCCRFVVAAFFCTLLILSGPASKADAPKTEQASVPAYLDYIPFDWEDAREMTRQEFLDGLHRAIRVDLDKEQATSTVKSIMQFNDPAQINALKALLKNRHNMLSSPLLGEPRLLFEADRGETQIFVTASGIASQGSNQWRLPTEDFRQLKQMLNEIYSGEPAEKEMSSEDGLSVYYLPLHSGTFVPVTENSITVGEPMLLSTADGATLLNLLQRLASTLNQKGKAPKIDPYNIRLRVEEARGKHFICVDEDGVVDDAGQTYKLTPDADKKLGQLINTWGY